MSASQGEDSVPPTDPAAGENAEEQAPAKVAAARNEAATIAEAKNTLSFTGNPSLYSCFRTDTKFQLQLLKTNSIRKFGQENWERELLATMKSHPCFKYRGIHFDEDGHLAALDILCKDVSKKMREFDVKLGTSAILLFQYP